MCLLSSLKLVWVPGDPTMESAPSASCENTVCISLTAPTLFGLLVILTSSPGQGELCDQVWALHLWVFGAPDLG